MSDFPSDIRAIQERNKRVEADKAWELSWTRRGCILAITYATAAIFLWLIGNTQFWMHALIPAGGYLLSTVSLPWLKVRWMAGRSPKS